MSNRFYVTTPIYYVNDAPHLGTAYTTVAADAFARQRSLRGMETRFLTGTDEHGLKIDRSARELGLEPQAFVDQISSKFRDAWPKLLCEPSDFIRTTEPRHKKVAQDLWERCRANGDIFEGEHEGWYCVSCEQFYPEKDLTEEKLCPIHKRAVEWTKETGYFFRLSRYQDKLLEHYEKHPEFVQPEGRRNEVISFVKEGLKDLSISRTTFQWGIPVPNDPKHVMYVWFDALTNYLSAVSGGPEKRFWPPTLQLVGKDIVRFHAIYWPAFLLSAGFGADELPKTVFAHGFLTINGQKMGKSLRNTVEPVRLAEYFGAGEVRYFLLREVALGQDGDFSHKKLISRIRADLAATLGNLLNRTLPFAVKHFDGAVPKPSAELDTDRERALRAKTRSLVDDAAAAWDALEPHRALECAIALAMECNGYFDARAPWSLAKDPARKDELATVIYHVLEVLRVCSVLLWAALPDKCDALRAQLGLDPLHPVIGVDKWPLEWGGLVAGSKLAPGAPLFRNITKDDEAKILQDFGVTDGETKVTDTKAADKPAKADATTPATPSKPAEAPATGGSTTIAFDDFAKVELKLGEVKSAERVPKSDKLLKLQVDLGEPSGPRQIIAGIGLSYQPEQLVGKKLVIVANLAPRKLMGHESHGMVLACGPTDGLSITTIEKDQPAGTPVK
ncbi:MAG: methionine--tRNA ligase [Myxococcales bacterium]|nr:methionine--tRNA ligase [Myxococcales bacterium]